MLELQVVRIIVPLTILIYLGECSKDAVEQLKKDLFRNYQKEFAPSQTSGKKVEVKYRLFIEEYDFNSATHELEIAGLIKSQWVDNRLTWSAKDYKNVFLIIGSYDRRGEIKAWTPMVSVQSIRKDMGSGNHKTVLYKKGWMGYKTAFRAMVPCKHDPQNENFFTAVYTCFITVYEPWRQSNVTYNCGGGRECFKVKWRSQGGLFIMDTNNDTTTTPSTPYASVISVTLRHQASNRASLGLTPGLLLAVCLLAQFFIPCGEWGRYTILALCLVGGSVQLLRLEQEPLIQQGAGASLVHLYASLLVLTSLAMVWTTVAAAVWITDYPLAWDPAITTILEGKSWTLRSMGLGWIEDEEDMKGQGSQKQWTRFTVLIDVLFMLVFAVAITASFIAILLS